MRNRVFLPLVTLLFLAAVAAAGAEREERPRNIILIGWDGAQRAHVKESLARGELPNLARLAAEGTIVAIDVLRVTDTKAGWAQILTGYEPGCCSGLQAQGRGLATRIKNRDRRADFLRLRPEGPPAGS